MVEAGILGPDDHVELLEGEIVEMSPEKSRHAAVVDLVADKMREIYADRAVSVRVQHPLDLGEASQPEPDVAVVEGRPREHTQRHPRGALIVVEVSDTSLEYDRTRKLRVYARAGIAEYWIVNLVEERVEIHRDREGDGYRSSSIARRGDDVAHAGSTFRADDLLP